MIGLRPWPLVGLTARAETAAASDSPFPRIYLKRSYPESLARFGAVPVILPASFTEEQLRAAYVHLHGLLLPGGMDVDPAHYGEEPHPALGEIDPALDAADLALTRWALADGKPILALCRGQQVLNVAAGGTLYQDLPSQRPDTLQHVHQGEIRYGLDHEIAVAPDSRLAGIFQVEHIRVNSVHHQAVKDVGPGFRAVAWADDGVVEAIERAGSEAFVLGVQCHPEELWQHEGSAFERLFEAFVAACRNRLPGSNRNPSGA